MASLPRIAVIGAGLMGHGIAQVFATHGYPVAIHDPVPAALASVPERIAANLRALDLDPAAAERVELAATIGAAVGAAEFVVEAGPEDLDLKQAIFAAIEAAAPATAILASNTSVMPITRIMERLAHPERALGTHWWNPPYQVPLVEVVGTARTADTAIERQIALLRAVGKTAVHVRRDVPGFVGNRLQHALWREAIALVEAGICDAETVDTVVKASFGRRLAVLGPLENADMVGTDLTLAIHRTVLPDLDRRPGPSPLLERLVAGGKLGFRTLHGFRRWTPETIATVRTELLAHLRKGDEKAT